MQSQKTLFETIYQLANAKNEKALATVIESTGCIGVFQGEYNPVMLLAKEGDYESVEFLISKFKAAINHAVRGAACGGHLEFTNDLIVRGANLDNAVNGAAGGGHVALVNDLIVQGASLNYAARGAASCDYNLSTQENALRFISFIDNSELRNLLTENVKKKIESLDTKKLLDQAAKLNLLMRERKLTFNQAQEYLEKR